MAAFLQILFLSFVFLLCHSNLCVNAGTITIVTPKQNLTKTESASALPAAGAPRLEASAGRALPGNIPDDLSVFSNGRKAILNVLQCLFQKEDRAQCFFDRAQRALDEQRSKLLAQADAEVDRYYSLKTGGRAKSEDKPTSVSHSVTQIITELTDMLSDSFGTFFNNKEDTTGTKDVNTITDELDDDEEEDEDIDTNAASEDGSSGVAERTSKAVARKKKKVGIIHKLLGLLKLLIAALVVKIVVKTLLEILAGHLSVKYFLVTLAYLILNTIKFWIWAKKAKEEHHSDEHVVYYDHHDTHHVPDIHHYSPPHSEDHITHPGYQAPPEQASSYWDRIYREVQPALLEKFGHKLAYAGQIPNRGTQLSRKKKKKGKIHKLIALIKLLVTGAVLKALLDTVLNLISTHLQKKFFFIAVVGLLLNLARFWFDAKKLHQPQKVIYYEHAQHQHHYEHPEDHHHGSGSFWGRSLDIKLPTVTTQETTHNIVYNAHIPL